MNFWDTLFNDGAIWAYEPADSALLMAEEFSKTGIQNILIPGVGYGRNAKAFLDKGISVSGIEISGRAIEVARTNGFTFPIKHGSVLDMPLDDTIYDGIYCYAVLHLFDQNERHQFLKACYQQLKPNGEMVFVVVSTQTNMFGRGKQVGKNRFQLENGLFLFFYDAFSIEQEFETFGLIGYSEIVEPIKHMDNEPPLRCYVIRCGK